ncbi:TIGR00341 family protein [Gayadomonas joobiniege]|uniref:TIGR00341 family protein n=1 Tax=Gayadomonas joobiniege TaxID=1234606 RepID=UPI000377291F|nr:TIGR00341 family protein [Gayadomonas joobiniege]
MANKDPKPFIITPDVRVFLICGQAAPNELTSLLSERLPKKTITECPVNNFLNGELELGPADLCILYLSDKDNYQVLPLIASYQASVALLPHPDAPQTVIGFGIHFELAEAIADIFTQPTHLVDVLKCNQEMVLNSVEVGDFVGLRPVRMNPPSLIDRVRSFGRRWRQIRNQIPFKVTLSTAKGKSITTAATAISIIEHASNTRFVQQLIGESNINDGMFHTVFLAPRSLRQLFVGLIKSVFNPSSRLPDFIGHIRTNQMQITTGKPIEFKIDGRQHLDSKLTLEIEKSALSLIPGRFLQIERSAPQVKEVFRTQHLPTADAVAELDNKNLPWNIHAGTEEFRELYQSLRENALASGNFLTLMALSTMLATVGLFANSAPVIIGAMILAPLMGPIISLAMGTVRQDQTLLTQSSKTLFLGLVLALFSGSLTALAIPLDSMTHEMAARISPNLLDLGVAIISGVAAAYANSRIEIAKSLAGVAIAVALVPPLATTAIALAWLDLDMLAGSFLLFLTNLSGIVLAAAITFSWLGFSPFKMAQKGLIIPVLVTALVSVPLAISFVRMMDKNSWSNQIRSIELAQGTITNLEIQNSSPILVKFDLIVKNYPTEDELNEIKQLLEYELEQAVTIQMTLVLER